MYRLWISIMLAFGLFAMSVAPAAAANRPLVTSVTSQSQGVTEAQLAVGKVSINSAGEFVVSPSYRGHYNFAALNAAMKGATRGGAMVAVSPETVVRPSYCWGWAYVPHWMLDALAWTIILSGAGVATVGFFISGTIFGLPAGAVLGALGLWIGVSGSYVLWYVDTYYQRGVWVCVE